MKNEFKLKPWELLDFTDDFIFSHVFEENPDLCKELLEMILNKKIEKICPVISQYSADVRKDAKGVRYDVYMKEPDKAVYDVEMQIRIVVNIEKRSRYYLDLLDLDQLAPGDDYENLRESYVIFIFKNGIGEGYTDAFYHYTMQREPRPQSGGKDGQKRESMVKSNQNEKDASHLQDGRHTIFLNAAGDLSTVGAEMRKFLEFVRNAKVPEEDSARGGFTKKLADAVSRVRESRTVRSEYMTLEMKAREWRDEGREEGMSNAFEIQSRLCDSLERAGRLSELPEALKDAQIREKLLREFGIVLS